MASRTLAQYHRDVISGRQRGRGAALMRPALGAIEPFYSLATRCRNRMFDRGIRAVVRVPRPVVSVGNITTGGTGKTPIVQWLVQRLVAAGRVPAILLRGYKLGDEARMLVSQLSEPVIEPDSDRLAAARRVIADHPEVNVFVLDDAFQHRRIHRDFDLVLIDATNPFGFNHVLPRGLLREPLGGLARASAFLLTHIDLATPEVLGGIESTLRRYNNSAPMFRCEHTHCGFEGAAITDKKVFSFCGIGNPEAFERQLDTSGAARVGSHRFDDHHNYSAADLVMLRDRARESGADKLVTTEKDWVKVNFLVGQVSEMPPIARARLAIQFVGNGEGELFATIMRAIGSLPDAAVSTRADAAASASRDGGSG
jgi:tetraacyldisaccharide 4'-kinase